MGKGKGGGSGGVGGAGCGRLMSFMAPLCVQRPNFGNSQWMGGGQSGWGSMGGGWAGSGMAGSGYYPGSMSFGTNSYWPSYSGSGYGAPSTTGVGMGSGYGNGYGTGYGSNYDTGSNQWSPWSYGQGGWSNSWPMGGGNRKGKTNSKPQFDRQQVITQSKINTNSNNPNNSNLGNHNFFPRFPTKSISTSQVRYPDKSSYNPSPPPPPSAFYPQKQSSYPPSNPNSKYDDIIVQQEII